MQGDDCAGCGGNWNHHHCATCGISQYGKAVPDIYGHGECYTCAKRRIEAEENFRVNTQEHVDMTVNSILGKDRDSEIRTDSPDGYGHEPSLGRGELCQ